MAVNNGQYFRPSMMTPVRVAPIAEFFGVYNNGNAQGVGATFTIPLVTIDNLTMAVNDRILFYNQATSPFQNGIYVVSEITADSLILTRAYDFQSPAQITPGNFCTVASGTNNKGKIFVVTTPQVLNIGVDPITFVIA